LGGALAGADASITAHYVKIAWGGFYGGIFCSGVGNGSLLFIMTDF